MRIRIVTEVPCFFAVDFVTARLSLLLLALLLLALLLLALLL